MDTMILCRFSRDLMGWKELIKLIKATTGLEFNEEQLREKANNITSLRRLINLREGLTKEDDMLPVRFFKGSFILNSQRIKNYNISAIIF